MTTMPATVGPQPRSCRHIPPKKCATSPTLWRAVGAGPVTFVMAMALGSIVALAVPRAGMSVATADEAAPERRKGVNAYQGGGLRGPRPSATCWSRQPGSSWKVASVALKSP